MTIETLPDVGAARALAGFSAEALVDAVIVLTHRVESAKATRPGNLPALRRQRDLAKAELIRRATP